MPIKESKSYKLGQYSRKKCPKCGADNRSNRNTCWKCDEPIHNISVSPEWGGNDDDLDSYPDKVIKRSFPMGWVLGLGTLFLLVGLPILLLTCSSGKSLETYNASSTVGSGVAKKDGTWSKRPDDLNELSRDWVFQRKQIQDAIRACDFEKAANYRKDFERTKRWLNDYRNEHVTEAIERAERERGGGR